MALDVTRYNCYVFADTMNQPNRFLLHVPQIQLLTLMFRCEILYDIISVAKLTVVWASLLFAISMLLNFSFIILHFLYCTDLTAVKFLSFIFC